MRPHKTGALLDSAAAERTLRVGDTDRIFSENQNNKWGGRARIHAHSQGTVAALIARSLSKTARAT